MSVKGENWNKLSKLSSNRFLTASNKLWRENLWLTAKIKANLKPGLKTKIVWNPCDKELGGERSLSMKTICFKISRENFRT